MGGLPLARVSSDLTYSMEDLRTRPSQWRQMSEVPTGDGVAGRVFFSKCCDRFSNWLPGGFAPVHV
jgi:hypothetical protein